MNELEIDQTYLDENFIRSVNFLDDEKFSQFINYLLENYEDDTDQNKISIYSKIISSLFGGQLIPDENHFYRQIKYLVNKGVYNRVSKKFKNDLLSLEISETKIEIVVEAIKPHLEKIYNLNKIKDQISTNLIVTDFEIKTEMPVSTSKYEMINEVGSLNEDTKKQNVILKFNLKNKLVIKDKLSNGNLVFQMDKTKLIDFYEQVEKIQEKLDKLY
jgi:hypothetical protein